MGKGKLEAEDITWKTVAYASLTHGGLILFVIIYTLIGGAAFKALEGPHERKRHEDAFKAREQLRIDYITRVKNITNTHFNNDIDMWYGYMVRVTKNLEKRLDVEMEEDFKAEWNFYGSLFFSGVVISTIGYGNIAPKTVGGRAFCMVYAVFGIALLLLVLASLGTLFARGATLGYRAMHLSVMMAKGEEKIKPKRAKRRSSLAMVLRENDDRAPERQTSSEDRRQKTVSDIWDTDYIHPDDKDSHVVKLRDREAELERQKSIEEEEAEVEENEDDVQIPVLGVLIFAFLYICLVAALIIIWEDWNYFEAFYFSFITLTTIGFGDLVPDDQKSLLTITFFILLGMAIMSMCIALAQDAIMRKVAWASQKIGVAIIKSQPT
ncbi:TWiK family of potassium channels protein 7-like [Amphiura filiformis]|uniref:TWiK family of potassium channels protein 7-like n=1 Tax=Amphiura filiformis TaxID=82378 RepID=UPI003B228BC0